MNQYRKEYQWSNIFAMIRNLSGRPLRCTEDFHNRLVVITGATSGIGYATARKFAAHGADFLFVNRNEQKTMDLCDALKQEYNTDCAYLIADFSKKSDVHQAARELSFLERDIDVLIHNAGIYNTSRILTEEGIESVFQTNYLSTFILNYNLRQKLIKQKKGRIIYVNSEAYRFMVSGLHFDDLFWEKHRYSGLMSYGSAKLAQLLSMIKFDEYFRGSGITINAMHPGNVRTNSGQNNGRVYKFFKKIFVDRSAQPVEDSAEALYTLGVSPHLDGISGRFFNLTTEEEPAPPALDRKAADRLWEISLKLGGLHE